MKVSTVSSPAPVNTGATIHQTVFGNNKSTPIIRSSVPEREQSAVAQPNTIANVPDQEQNDTKLAQESKVVESVTDSRTKQALESLTRKEQEIRKAQQSLKLAQEQWRNEQGQYLSKKDLQEQTLKILNENGITNQRLIELQLGIGQDSQAQADPISQEIASLKSQIAELKANTDNRDTAARTQAEQIVKNDARLLVDNDPAYQVTKTMGLQHEVAALVIQNFDATGEMLSIEEAARLVEGELIERTLKQRAELDKLDVIQKRLAPKDDSVVAPQQGRASIPAPTLQNAIRSTQRPQQSTLTHKLGSTRPLTARERAIQAFEATRQNK